MGPCVRGREREIERGSEGGKEKERQQERETMFCQSEKGRATAYGQI